MDPRATRERHDRRVNNIAMISSKRLKSRRNQSWSTIVTNRPSFKHSTTP
jgi:hypothetical protein